MPIRSFANWATEEINYGRTSKRARRALPPELHERARIKLARLHAATSLADLAALPGNRFEALKGDRRGQYSLRINDQYRIVFNGEMTRPSKLKLSTITRSQLCQEN